MSKKRKSTPENESKRNKFRRVVEPRVRKAIKAISLVGNCAGSGYEYKSEDIALIAAAMEKAINQVVKRYTTKGTQTVDFDLD